MKLTWLVSRSAGVTIGWIRLMESLFLLAAASVGLSSLYELGHKESDSTPLPKILASIGIVFFGLDAIASSLLIIGTIKGKHVLLVPWIINTVLGIIASIVFIIIAIKEQAGCPGLFLFFHTALYSAFFTPISCIYKKIKETTERVL